MTAGGLYTIHPSDDLDPESVCLKGKQVRFIRTREGPSGINDYALVELVANRDRLVLRLKDLKEGA